MKILPTSLPDLTVIEPHHHEDPRGGFVRLFNGADLAPLFGHRRVRQVNLSLNPARWTLRGMHFQRPPASEAKIVGCLAGAILDVAVDLRSGSPGFLSWHAEELSRENRRMLFIPEGFAHGFMTLEADSQVVYVHSGDYAPEDEDGLRHDDPRLAIAWPEEPAVISQRDRSFALLGDDFQGVAP